MGDEVLWLGRQFRGQKKTIEELAGLNGRSCAGIFSSMAWPLKVSTRRLAGYESRWQTDRRLRRLMPARETARSC